MNIPALLISVILHPLLMATYLFLLFSLLIPTALYPVSGDEHVTFISLVFIATFALPVMCLAIFRSFGTIRSFTMTSRRERIVPFVFITVIYLSLTYLLYQRTGNFSASFLRFLVIIDMLVIASAIATFFFKVSVHCIGVWGMIGILLPLNKITGEGALFYPTLMIILLAGFVMSARLALQVHTPREVMWGSVLGLATGMAGMFILFA